MNDKVTISTFQLFAMFPDAESARSYFEGRLWPDGATCPVCSSRECVTPRKAGFYRCNTCAEDFTVRTGTVMERSHVPLHKWLYAMYLLVTARKGISSMQLSKEIGVTQKTAWFLLHRLREACGGDLDKLRGIVQVDETFVGGLEGNKHKHKKLNLGRGAVGKSIVVGLRDESGAVRAAVIPSTDADSLQGAIHKHVEVGSTIHTDEHAGYLGIEGLFFAKHEQVNHGAGEYVSTTGVTVNAVESVWAVFKRGLIGVYHHVEKKNLKRYVDEFAFRLNDGNVKVHTLDRLDSFVDAIVGKRLTYAELIA